MDKQLIQRLTLAARFPQPPAQEHMTAFAALVAEECAKIAERHQLADTTCGISMSVPASPFHAAMIRKAFKASEVLDWRAVVVKVARRQQDRPQVRVQVHTWRADGTRGNFTFETSWLRTASDEDILRAIDASEAPR